MPGEYKVTEEELDEIMKHAVDPEPGMLAAGFEYLPGLDAFVLSLASGEREIFPREKLQGLQNRTLEELTDFEIMVPATAIWWNTLDLGFTVEGLREGRFGNRWWMAELGRRGGSVSSEAKTKAARANGQKGGRPKRKAA